MTLKKHLLLALFSIGLFVSCSQNTPINQLVKFTVKPEQLKGFKEVAIESLKGSLKEAGNVEMELYEDENNPNVLYVYSRWEDKEAMAYHNVQPYGKKIKAFAQHALQLPPDVMILEETKPKPNHHLKSIHAKDSVETLFFIFKFKEGYSERLLKQFEEHITNARLEDGNILFDLYAVEGVEDTFVVYEKWRNKSALWDIHFNQPYAKETGALLQEALVGKFEDCLHSIKEIE